MLINDVAKKYGLTIRTLRYYDELGILSSSRTDSNVRDFDTKQLKILEEILVFKQLGFSLIEIRNILEAPDSVELTEKLNGELLRINQELTEVLYKKHLYHSLLSTFGSSDISKRNLEDFVREQLYFKNHEITNLVSYIGRVTIEIGEGLVPLVVSDDEISLIHAIKILKAEFKNKYDEEVDLIWVKDNVEELDMLEYQIVQDDKVLVKKTIFFDERTQQIEHIISNLRAVLL